MIIALTIGVLITGAVYLMFQRGMVRIIFGMTLLSHAANLMLLAAGVGAWRGEAFAGERNLSAAADPLPQAFVLTAIVIAMATTTILLATAALGRNDDTDDAEGAEGPRRQDTHAGDPFSTLGRDAVHQDAAHQKEAHNS
ncbi:cation:proton antiporter subunit C [Corynebacterium yudongzhengii]|uniref:cation:proton antiporter subunit C n=1 Tax=Corynebacterium yudongzhengii TaxID=2080740 RepID=UPI0018EEC6F1|nr:cation:proton antiporter subunit C [Corynebacterium yudongzhengii]